MNLREKILQKASGAMGINMYRFDSMQTAGGAWWDSGDEDGIKRKGVYTDAFWLAPPYGRPRDIDYDRLEAIEKSVWVRMCVQHIVDRIAGADWNIVPMEKGADVPQDHIDKPKEFFNSMTWDKPLSHVIRMLLPDAVQYDAGVILKSYPVIAYEKENWRLKSTQLPPLQLYARDGRSFMMDTNLFGQTKTYWQYSWINPQGKPIEFSPDEIIYFQKSPMSRGPYGIAALEIIEEIIDYMIDSTLAQSKYWKNGLFVGGQIDLPDVRDLDELKRQQAYFEAKLRGPRKYNKWIVTGGGAKVQSMPFTSQQMQFIDSQKWFAKMVFAVFELTPSELGFCHSEDTEFLTSNGFKLYDDITDADLIGSYNRETGNLEYQHPIKKYHYEYNGEMIHFNGRSVDALVTPNHRMFVQPYNYDEWRVVEAKDVSWKQFHFKQACGWDTPSKIDVVEIPIPISKEKDNMPREILTWNLNDFLELLGWFVSEGCATEYGQERGHYRIDISQNDGSNADEIRAVLNRLEIKFNEYKNDTENISFIFSNKQIYEFIKPMKDELPRWIIDLPVNQLDVFLSSLCKGDGHVCNVKNNRIEFYTTKKTIADQVHEIAIKCGYRTNLGNRTYKQENWKDLYTVYMSKYTDRAYLEQNNISKEQYNGFVNCFAVPNGYLITRRNGKILISHNTEDLNKATGIQQMEIHKSAGIRPWLKLIEDMFNRHVVWSDFTDDVKFEFVNTLDLADKNVQTDIDIARLGAGLDSVNELRLRDGLDAWDDEKYDLPTGDAESPDEGLDYDEDDDMGWESMFGDDESLKAARVGALSGTPGFVPKPPAYDGMKKPIKTKKLEDKSLKEVMEWLEELKKKAQTEVDRLYSGGI